jgi:hypothetical protein
MLIVNSTRSNSDFACVAVFAALWVYRQGRVAVLRYLLLMKDQDPIKAANSGAT